MTKRDGFGRPLNDAVMYFVQDTRDVVGNAAVFWGKDRCGYVCGLGRAGLYTAHEVAQMQRDTDVPWPESFIQKHAELTLDVQRLPRPRRALAGPRGVLP